MKLSQQGTECLKAICGPLKCGVLRIVDDDFESLPTVIVKCLSLDGQQIIWCYGDDLVSNYPHDIYFFSTLKFMDRSKGIFVKISCKTIIKKGSENSNWFNKKNKIRNGNHELNFLKVEVLKGVIYFKKTGQLEWFAA